MENIWRKCSSCKKEIPLRGRYYECSVSTCTSKRTGYVFCSVPCFERHLPGARHKDAAAIECQAPAQAEPASEISRPVSSASTGGGQRRIVKAPVASSPATASPRGQANNNEILVVVSKLKKYVQDRGGMNTSQSVMNVLSNKLRRLCDQAIAEAERDGRKTIMDRDFK